MRSVCLMCALCCIGASQGLLGDSSQPAAYLTTEVIYQAARRQLQGIRSLRVRWVDNVKVITRLPNVPDDALRETRIIEVAFQGDRRLVKESRPSNTNALDRQSVSLYDGKRTYVFKRGYVMVYPGKKQDIELPATYCRAALQIPLSDFERAEPDNRWFYPHVLRKVGGRSMYRVLRSLELVDGAWCHVLDYPGRDRLWVDPDLGCLFRRRRRFSYRGGRGVPRIEHHLSHFVQRSGVWAPMKAVIDVYVPLSMPEQYWGQKYYVRTMEVQSIAINECESADFDFEVPAGTWVFSDEEQYRVPGDRARLLSEVVHQAKSLAPRRFLWRPWFVLGNLLAIAAAIGLATLWYRVQRHSNRRA